MPIPAALIPLIMGGAQMIGGAIKRSKKRPEYEIPESQKEALTLAKLNTGDMPGYDQMAANIALSQSNSLASARESGNVMESVGAIAGASNTAYRDLGIANSQSKRESERNLQGMLMEQAKAEDTAFQMNEFAPYVDERTEGSQMIGAGMSNIVGAIDEQNAYSQIEGLFGKGGATTPAASYKARASSATALNPMILSILPELLRFGIPK